MNAFFQRAILLALLVPMWFIDLFDDPIGRAAWRRGWWRTWRDCPMKWRDAR